MYKPSRLLYPTVSTYLRPGLKTPWGWIFAETPFSAISQIQVEPRVSRSEAAVAKRLVRMVPGFYAELDCSLMQFNNPNSTKNENKKDDNSPVKTFDAPRALPARFTDSTRPRLLCVFARSASDL
jgi:hypothetical protein